MSTLGLFSAAEVYDMAIQTEQSGKAFYEAAAGAAKERSVKDLMVWLGEQEAQHEAAFRALKEESSKRPPAETYAGERSEYVQALLESRVLPGAEAGVQAVGKMASDLEAVDFALRFEKDTILFMYEMREVVPEDERARIEVLIREEKNHVRRLNSIKAARA